MIVKSILQFYFSTELVLKFSACTYQMTEMTDQLLAFLQHAQVEEVYFQTYCRALRNALLLHFAQIGKGGFHLISFFTQFNGTRVIVAFNHLRNVLNEGNDITLDWRKFFLVFLI